MLFALLGVFLVIAAFKSQYQRIALVAGLVSALAFLWLAWSVGDYNANISRVVIADVVAIVCLVVAGGLLTIFDDT